VLRRYGETYATDFLGDANSSRSLTYLIEHERRSTTNDADHGPCSRSADRYSR
jgi:hypothetical protein